MSPYPASPDSVFALVSRYLDEESPLKAETTQRHDSGYARLITEAFGDLPISEVTPSLVSRFHRQLTAERGPTLANRVLSMVSQVCRLAERDDLRPAQSNPTTAVRRNPEPRRTDFLTEPLRIRFLGAAGDALAAGEITRSAWIIICLMLLAGLRWSEARLLRWEEVDLEHACLRYLPRRATRPVHAPVVLRARAQNKGGDQRTVSLNDDALEVLRLAPRFASWVAPNPRTLMPYTDIRCALRRICERADVQVTPHGLRHSFGSEAADAGCSLYEISLLLGQRSQASAERYIHATGRAGRSAAQKLATRRAGRMA